MTDGHRAGHVVQDVLIEHGADQTGVLMAVDHAVFVYGDTGSLLTAVLESKQCGIRVVRGGNLLPSGRCDTEYTATSFMHLVKRSAAFS